MNPDLPSALSLQRSGHLTEADAALRRILASDPGNATAHYHRGVIAHLQGRLIRALVHLSRAQKLDPGQPAYPYLKGIVLHDLKHLDEAVACLDLAITLKPDFFQAYNNLSLVLKDQGRLDEALHAIETALRLKPDYATGYNNLGTLFHEMGRRNEAVVAYQRAVSLQPGYAHALDNLGQMQMRSGHIREAESAFNELIRITPQDSKAYWHLAQCLQSLGRNDGAISSLRRALTIRPDFPKAQLKLAMLLADVNQPEKAREQYRLVLSSHPRRLRAALGIALTLPVVYSSTTELNTWRRRYADGLEDLLSRLDTFENNPGTELLDDLHWGNFYLAYQGQNDRDLQAGYGHLTARMLQLTLPELMCSTSRTHAEGRRIRVGFVSSFFRMCTVGMYFKSWITRLDPARFETFVYHLHPRIDQVGEEIRKSCAHFIHVSGSVVGKIEAIANPIRDAGLDVLIYPELGMDSQSYLLAALRLAPVQCCGWGHPVTSGRQNIDFFLSSDIMEPDDAADCYTEQLIRLDGIGTYYERPPLPPPRHREDFGLPADRNLYLFPQSPFKIHPDNDALLGRILGADPDGTLVFFEGRHPAITDAFLHRFRCTLSSLGLPTEGRFVVLPYMNHDDYLRVNMLCDVMLDCLHWSGGNTSLDALACGLPVVTLPGELMRARQSAGMLELLNVPDLIAHDKDEYVQIALRLTHAPDWRHRIQTRISAGSVNLFERMEPIRALERFLEHSNQPE